MTRLPLELLNSVLPRAFLIFSVVLIKEIEMRKYALVLTATAAILACGAIAAIAQAPGAATPGTQQSPPAQPTPGGSGGVMGPGLMRDHPGMMGAHPGIMGMMGRDYGHHSSVMARRWKTHTTGVASGARAYLQGDGYRPRWHRYPGGNGGFHARY